MTDHRSHFTVQGSPRSLLPPQGGRTAAPKEEHPKENGVLVPATVAADGPVRELEDDRKGCAGRACVRYLRELLASSVVRHPE